MSCVQIDKIHSGLSIVNSSLNISSGWLGSELTVGTYGQVCVMNGGYVENSLINAAGAIILSSGAGAEMTQVSSGGGLHVYSGAIASRTTVNQGGYFGVGDGAKTYETTIAESGSLTVWNGGVVASNTEKAPPKVINAEPGSRKALIPATPCSPVIIAITINTNARTRPIIVAISKTVHPAIS